MIYPILMLLCFKQNLMKEEHVWIQFGMMIIDDEANEWTEIKLSRASSIL